MSPIVKKYYRRKFLKWKKRVKVRLPHLAVSFYTAKYEGYEVDERDERQLGRVIQDINSYEFGIGPGTEAIAAQVMLEIDVEEIFALVYGKMLNEE